MPDLAGCKRRVLAQRRRMGRHPKRAAAGPRAAHRRCVRRAGGSS